ncbi:MAG: AAA family ATPase [Bacteroidia bacterium]|nr:AAA family ATPase [Bacteroidia bacterium]
MAEFNRRPETNNIFEGTYDEVIEVVLKIKDDFNDRYNRNPENKLRAEQLREILLSENRICYFQKQKADDQNNRSRHKIIIPVGNERAVEFVASLWTDKIDIFTELYSYRVAKFKEIGFFNEPTKNTTIRNCKFRFADINQIDGTNANSFKDLYSTIESSEIPLIDINKEKDKKIWQSYVDALKKLVKQKEQVWKIQNIKMPYAEARQGEAERANYIDIFINETELREQLEKDILGLFNESELEDYGVSENKAFIEFKNYRELGQEELNQLKELGDELFYEISNNSPFHTISGKIDFKYADNVSKEDIYLEIQDKLETEYQLECSISNIGYIDLNENDIPHLRKIIEDNYSHILSVHKDNIVQLKVDFKTDNGLQQLIQPIKQKLDSEGLDRARISITQGNNLLIEVGAFIPNHKFNSEGLTFVESVSRFQAMNPIKVKPINGIELFGNVYQIKNASKEDIDNALALLQQNFSGVSFRRLPTQYFFKVNEKVNPETLRNFKTQTDLQGKTEFVLANSTLKISAESNTDYENQLKRIKQQFPSATIEEKTFNPAFQILFDTDVESKRQNVINKIQNEIRKEIGKSVDFDTVKKHTRILFSYQFKTDDERDSFKQAISTACSEHRHILNYTFENPLGRTIYELFKNETLELEKEKEVRRNVSQATFIYLNPAQRQNLSEKIEQFGEEAVFREGIQIGRLVKKEKDRLKFKITDAFDEIINGKFEDRIELSELKKGFIKPIFPGELTNIGRMIRAMKKVTEPNTRNGFPVNQNLPNFLFDPNEARQSSTDLEEEKQKVVQNLNEPLLKDQPKQLEAVAKTLLAKDLALIQGPPGTGKTTVIAEIIWQTLSRDSKAKLLITSQTNLAVDNALERIKGKKLVRPIRVGNIDKFEDEGKVYSNDRIKNWIQAKTGSKEEKQYSDNAVCQWIENVKEKCSKEEKYAKAVSKWRKGLDEKDVLIKSTFSNAYYEYVNVFAATCSECGSRNFGDTYQMTFNQHSERKSEPEFDLVIMDEASKATPPELVLPLTLGKKVVIIGDHKQLPPMIDEKEFGEALEAVGAKKLIEDWTKEDYKVSQFEKLFKNAPKNFVASLDTQFRMHGQIMDCISQFYSDQEELKNGLICGIKGEMNIPDFNVKASRWHGLSLVPFIEHKHHAIWVNVETPEDKVGTSYENEGEIQAIQTVLRALTKAEGFEHYQKHFKKDEDKEIGIITYYMPQMQSLRKALYPQFSKNEWRNFEQHKFENEFQIPFRINTVDRFQGMERNIIIVSTVRSNKQYKEERGKKIPIDNIKYPFALGFARELQRINVGFSRAKRLLIVVGNEKHFSHKPEYQKAIQKMHPIDIAQIQNLIK